jgi:spore maturation protein SpmA
MALNYIWIGFFLIAFIVALVRTVGYYFRDSFGVEWLYDTANANVFNEIVESTFSMANTSVKQSIGLIGVMALWMGIMKIGEKGGAVKGMAWIFGPLFRKIFPDISKDSPAHGSMLMNFSANMLGLDNAATPLGLKAMGELQKENPNKEVASNSQITFMVLNTSGLTLIPVSVMALRATAGAHNPADIFIPILIATYFSTIIGLIVVSIRQRINLFNPTIFAYLIGISAFIAGIIYYFSSLDKEQIGSFSAIAGNGILMIIITLFLTLALIKKINVYETFIDGAKEGFNVAIKIIPYLVAMLVAVGVFRASGAMEFLTDGIRWIVELFTVRTEWVDGVPTALMKPLSGSGARGVMVEAMQVHGVDSFVGRLVSTLQGSTETTFYVLAVYFGSVGIKNTRYALGAGLLADLAGIIAAIIISYIFFPI